MKQKRVLFCVLNWGIGHATRSKPIISKLLESNFHVHLASDGEALRVLRSYFPTLHFTELPAYQIQYSNKGSMALTMIKQMPKLYAVIKREHQIVNSLVDENRFDYIFSDHRYGCYHKQVHSIFIAHQLQPILPAGLSFLQSVFSSLHKKLLLPFHAHWVPDVEGEQNLSGKLSIVQLPNKSYMGYLSALNTQSKPVSRFEYIALLSGPEPQRTALEKILSTQMKQTDKKCLLIKGLPQEGNEIETNGNYSEVGYLYGEVLSRLLTAAQLIFCRSGYSSIMDMQRLGKRVVFIPTPGQTEQEYLAHRMERQGIAYFMPQQIFDISEAVNKSQAYSGFKAADFDESVLDKLIKSL